MGIRSLLVGLIIMIIGCGNSNSQSIPATEFEPYAMNPDILSTVSVDAVSPDYGLRVSVAPGVPVEQAARELDAELGWFLECFNRAYGYAWTPSVAQGLRFYFTPSAYTCFGGNKAVGWCFGEYDPTWIVTAWRTQPDPLPLPWLSHELRHAYMRCEGCTETDLERNEVREECVRDKGLDPTK